MLATDKISGAFHAIVEEVEKIKKTGVTAEVEQGLSTIISIARHQSDIRDAKKGSCAGHKKEL